MSGHQGPQSGAQRRQLGTKQAKPNVGWLRKDMVERAAFSGAQGGFWWALRNSLPSRQWPKDQDPLSLMFWGQLVPISISLLHNIQQRLKTLLAAMRFHLVVCYVEQNTLFVVVVEEITRTEFSNKLLQLSVG